MFRTLWILLSLSLLPNLALAAPPVAGTESHGGAGTTRNGQYVTFYSAGFYTEPTPPAEARDLPVPGLDELIKFVDTFPDFSSLTKASLQNAIVPTPKRKYLRVDETRFDEETRTRLLDEFARVMQVDRREVRLYAVTDIAKLRTYLLPAFFTLKPSDQVAVLFHEAFWILNPNQTYEWIVSAEMAFQAVYEQPSNSLRIMELMKYLSKGADRMKAAVGADRRAKALPESFRLVDLLGLEFFSCMSRQANYDWRCGQHALAPLYRYIQKHPRSQVLKAFQDAFVGRKSVGIAHPSSLPHVNLNGVLALESSYRWSECTIRLELWTSASFEETYGMPVTCPYELGAPREFILVF